MAKLKCKKYDLSAKELGEVELDCGEDSSANTQMIKDYIVALRANSRQWSASTKTRAKNRHSGAKPHAQKGTGKARQGFLGSPQYKGGGRVHAPLPKFDQHVRINRKERRAAIRHLLVQKLEKGEMIVLGSNFGDAFEQPKTKVISNFLKAVGWDSKKTLCLAPAEAMSDLHNFKLSARNLEKLFVMPVENINGYDILVNQKFIVLDSVLDQLVTMLRG